MRVVTTNDLVGSFFPQETSYGRLPGGAALREKVANVGGIAAAAERGQRAALFAGSSRSAAGGAAADAAAAGGETPDWARRLRSEQAARHHRHVALQAVKEGDRGGAAATPDIKERED